MERVFILLQNYFDIVCNVLGLIMTKSYELCSEILLFVCFCECSAYMVLMIFMLKTEMHSKGYKRVKIHFEGEDYDSTANSVTMHNVPKKKQEKATSRSISDSDPFGIPKLPEVLDTSQFGSKAKEIEVLFARRARLLNYDVAINHRLHDTCSEVPKNHCKEPSKLVNQQVTHLARQNVINLEPSNGGTAIASNVIYLSSDDEESGQGTRSALTVKDLSLDDEERGQGTGSAPIVMDLNSNDEDNGQGRHSHIFQRVEPEPVRGLLMEDSMVSLFLHV